MILSTVNLVNNYKFADFIIDKITEEQKLRDTGQYPAEEEEEKKRVPTNKRHSVGDVAELKVANDVEFKGRKRSSLRVRSDKRTKSPSLSPASDDVITKQPSEVDPSSFVSIATTNDYTLVGDCTSLHVSLKKNAGFTAKCVFRRIDFEQSENEPRPICLFQLLDNPLYYLATTHLQHLELQSYCTDTLDPDRPDERFFVSFRQDSGIELLQPYHHKGFYLHHIDDVINLRKFELNLRPPEEYFLIINSVDPDLLQLLVNESVPGDQHSRIPMDEKSIQSDAWEDIPDSQEASDGQVASGAHVRKHNCHHHHYHHHHHPHNGHHHDHHHHHQQYSKQTVTPVVADISKSSLKRKDSKKVKEKGKEGSLTLKPSMLSCFGVGLRKKKDKSKR